MSSAAASGVATPRNSWPRPSRKKWSRPLVTYLDRDCGWMWKSETLFSFSFM